MSMKNTSNVQHDIPSIEDPGRISANQTSEQVWIDPQLLHPHPRQASIYGEEDVQDLIEAIRVSQQIKPLIVTPQNVLLSGHRRRQAALALGWERVQVERVRCADAREEMEILLRENQYREKTRVQRVRETAVWREIETANAAQRRSAALKRGNQSPVREVLPTQEAGRVRTILAKRSDLGSERTYEKAAQVVTFADQLTARGEAAHAQTLLTVLNEQSVDAAARVLKLAAQEQQAVLAMLATGETQTVHTALLAVKKAQAEARAQSLPVRPRVVLASWEQWLAAQPPCDLLLTDPPYATDVPDIAAFAQAWLPRALANVKATGRAFVCIGSYPEELHAYLHLHQTKALPLPQLEILVWTYRNTLGPQPKRGYKRNWQAVLHFTGPDAPDLACPLLTERFAVMEFNAPDGRLGERYHTWQKPDALAERLIQHASRPGEYVYDPFCGTGTFVLAAHRLGRIASGCDHDPQMLALARQRGCAVDEEQVRLEMDMHPSEAVCSKLSHAGKEIEPQ